ncbi:protein sorting system archaetidylserine decarboxylase [Halalkalicoccus jeotgali]|uniref:Phosphatidylserine decarboxylase n=1 Tax=Halalkalicoccus jeotgali (strain DSM 18796 / CECT 7217 / JCM 14584 / KCTC 4019 / B3) TaxID=795797 RepID=D8J3F6_HALJB|nr:protein sorting system archaetidylserine decarboxylase [Halalkalicoccus jeotgali]ADJ15263.1 phosphatidylserine decarboxylase [Halalkalicoccus jeotgali B3]ELY35316.1 phosphatidylserine decarboxylase [Halalkalicoccus jeotgali B3]
MKFASGAWWYVVPLLLLAFPAFVVSPMLGGLFVIGAAGTLFFFRDPERTPPFTGIVSPADGKISEIRTEGDQLRVCIFMNVHDVHVVRAPDDGVVQHVEHESGGYRPAFSKESDRNEKVRIGFEESEVTLIAGAFARRITPYVEEGEELERAERLGHIAFGSRVDVLLPPEIHYPDLRVERGEKITAGETKIASPPGANDEWEWPAADSDTNDEGAENAEPAD